MSLLSRTWPVSWGWTGLHKQVVLGWLRINNLSKFLGVCNTMSQSAYSFLVRQLEHVEGSLENSQLLSIAAGPQAQLLPGSLAFTVAVPLPRQPELPGRPTRMLQWLWVHTVAPAWGRPHHPAWAVTHCFLKSQGAPSRYKTPLPLFSRRFLPLHS